MTISEPVVAGGDFVVTNGDYDFRVGQSDICRLRATFRNHFAGSSVAGIWIIARLHTQSGMYGFDVILLPSAGFQSEGLDGVLGKYGTLSSGIGYHSQVDHHHLELLGETYVGGPGRTLSMSGGGAQLAVIRILQGLARDGSIAPSTCETAQKFVEAATPDVLISGFSNQQIKFKGFTSSPALDARKYQAGLQDGPTSRFFSWPDEQPPAHRRPARRWPPRTVQGHPWIRLFPYIC